MIKFVFLDMDGILADFNKGVHAAHNRQDVYVVEPEKALGVFDLEKLWEISIEDFWKPTQSPGFWESLDKMPEADDIVNYFCAQYGIENVCILTSPSKDKYCIPEKRNWMQRYYPHLAKNMLFGSEKTFLAAPDRMLVDDRNEDVDSFCEHGGLGLLYPRPWNRFHSKQMERFNYGELMKRNCMIGKVKYGFNLGGRFVHPDTQVEILRADDPNLLEYFPNISIIEGSKQVVVQFDFLNHPTIVHESQIEF